jgi:AcrR family transcriptional regulator
MATKAKTTSREAILEAGLRVFSARGYHGASIREIARESGITLSVLYHFFDSKDDLFGEIMRISAGRYFEMCEQRLETAGEGPRARLRALIDATVEHRVERRTEANMLASEIRLVPEAMRESARRDWRRVSELWAEVIRAGIASGDFSPPYPDEARRGIIAMCNAVRYWYHPSDGMSLDEVSERLYMLATAMLVAR